MAWTQTDLDALDEALAMGALEVRTLDRTVKYRSIAELIQVRRIIQEELGTTLTAAEKIQIWNPRCGSGL